MSDGRMQVWGDAKTTAVQRRRVNEVTISGVHETVLSWPGELGGGSQGESCCEGSVSA